MKYFLESKSLEYRWYGTVSPIAEFVRRPSHSIYLCQDNNRKTMETMDWDTLWQRDFWCFSASSFEIVTELITIPVFKKGSAIKESWINWSRASTSTRTVDEFA